MFLFIEILIAGFNRSVDVEIQNKNTDMQNKSRQLI